MEDCQNYPGGIGLNVMKVAGIYCKWARTKDGREVRWNILFVHPRHCYIVAKGTGSKNLPNRVFFIVNKEVVRKRAEKSGDDCNQLQNSDATFAFSVSLSLHSRPLLLVPRLLSHGCFAVFSVTPLLGTCQFGSRKWLGRLLWHLDPCQEQMAAEPC